jgi:EthD domain
MLKMIYCLRRVKSLSLEEFQGHWLEFHSQFGKRLKSLRRYVQYHALANDPIREAMAQAGASHVETYDGLAIGWFDSREAMQSEMDNATVAAALADEKYFIDHTRSVALIADERVVVEPEAPGNVVLVECLRRRSDIDRKRFSELWSHHAHIGRRAHEAGLLMGYIQNHALLGDDARVKGLASEDEPWDGVVTAYFDSIAKFKALVASPLASKESYEDEKKFIDHSQSVDFLARRHVIKDLIR